MGPCVRRDDKRIVEREKQRGKHLMSDQLFAGLKVIDCASFIAAPLAATVLSDFGADVIKIEPPGEGDAYRRLHANPGTPKSNVDYAWMHGARNKRGIALDLKTTQGLEVL